MVTAAGARLAAAAALLLGVLAVHAAGDTLPEGGAEGNAGSRLLSLADFPSLAQPWSELLTAHGALAFARDFWAVIGPGGKWHPAYFLEHKGHLVIEGLLLAVILYLILQQSYKVQRKAEAPLTEKVR